MSWTLAATAIFDRRVRKFLAKQPDLRPRFVEAKKLLRDSLPRVGHELQHVAVDTVALVGGWWAVVEDVAEVDA
jgi:hypothetical protein